MRFNFRPLTGFALAAAAGILIGFASLGAGTVLLWVFGALTLLLAALPLLLRRFVRRRGVRRSVMVRHAGFVALCCFFAALSCALFFTAIRTRDPQSRYEGEPVTVLGSVTDIHRTATGKTLVYVKDCTFTGAEGVAERGKGTAAVFIDEPYEDTAVRQGEQLAFIGVMECVRAVEAGGINSHAVRSGERYFFRISGIDPELAGEPLPENGYVVLPGNADFFTKIRRAVRDTLNTHLDEENAQIAYALITGESRAMGANTRDLFRETGVMHIFSVSGLHIGVLSGALLWLLETLRVRRRLHPVIVLSVLLFYAAICRFTPSVLRSAAMASALLLGRVTGRKYDPLSALSAAVLVIVLCAPLMLFDAGLLLSAAAVLGILFFNRTILRLLRRLPKRLAAAASLTLSAQIGMLPLMAVYFGSVPFLSILLNLIAIPVSSAAYIALLVLTVPALLLPFLGFMLFLPECLIVLVRLCSVLWQSAGLALLPVLFGGVAAALYYAVVIAASRFTLCPKRVRAVLCGALSLMTGLFLLTGSGAVLKDGRAAAVFAENGGVTVVREGGVTTAVVYRTQYGTGAYLADYLLQCRIGKLDVLVFAEAVPEIHGVLDALDGAGIGTGKLVCPYFIGIAEADLLTARLGSPPLMLLPGAPETLENMTLTAYFYDETFCGVYLRLARAGLLFATGGGIDGQLFITDVHAEPVDVLFSADTDAQLLIDAYRPSRTLLVRYLPLSEKAYYSIYTRGDLIFDF